MRIRCKIGLHKWKFIGIIGNPEYKLYRCLFCPAEKRKPNEADPHWWFS